MSKKIAPTLSAIVLPKYRYSQERYIADEAWPTCATELRALLAVERAVRKEHRFCPTFEKCPACRALARLDRLSSGTGKRKEGMGR